MRTVPILILSGFLGSGKTTLLTRILKVCSGKGISPAVIMNEIGEVNLDGQLIEEIVPLREMLSGCICCTIRSDLSMELTKLIEDATPDLVIIEATGVANPIEILDTITESAMITPIEIRANITTIDAADYLHRSGKGKGKTYRLMTDQIRCASMLLVNKSDLVSAEELNQIKEEIAMLNPAAPMLTTIHCNLNEIDWNQLLGDDLLSTYTHRLYNVSGKQAVKNKHNHEHCHDHHEHKHYHSYDHLMVHTYYIPCSVRKINFEEMFKTLPDNIYRAKGIYTDMDTGRRIMFQYAFKELQLIPIQPQGTVQDVAVFIGEHFLREDLLSTLERAVSSGL